MNGRAIFVAMLLLIAAFAIYIFTAKAMATGPQSDITSTMAPPGQTIMASLPASVANEYYFLQGNYTWTYVIFLPNHYNPAHRYPLIVGMPGAGQTANYYITYWENASDTYNFVLAFLQSNTSTGWYAYPGAQFEVAVLRQMKAQYNISSAFLAGCSAGGKIVYASSFWEPGTWNGFAMMATDMSFYTPSQQDLANIQGVNYYIIQGQNDPDALLANSEKSINMLRQSGANVIFTPLPGQGHVCPQNQTGSVERWFEALAPSQ